MHPSKIEFPEITPQEWKLKVQAELAGLDYNELLVWGTTEGIQVKPLYTIEDTSYSEIQPIQTTKDWKLIGNFLNDDQQDLSYLYGVKISDKQAKFTVQLPEYIDLFFDGEDPFQIVSGIPFSAIKNLKYLALDVIGNLCKTGNWYRSKKEDLDLTQEILSTHYFHKSIVINASLYQNSGANHVQQIAFAIAHGVEYLELLGAESAQNMYFRVAVGSNYFFEMAKLRALRNLWDFIVKEYHSDADTFIFVESSLRNKSTLDIHNNLIRSGLEASSAIQGKADAVYIYPFDEIQGSSIWGEELGSKQQLLLQKESYFDRFMDPIFGSFYVENLTQLMQKNAWDLVQKLESEGGFLQQVFDGKIQKMISKSAEKEQIAFDEGKLTMIGVNKFRNTNDTATYQNTRKMNPVKTLIQPIFPKRLASKLEMYKP